MARSAIFTREFWKDARERVASTFIQAFVGAVPVQAAFTAAIKADVDTLQQIGLAAGMAGVAAALSMLKAVIAARVPDTVSPASLAGLPKEDPLADGAPQSTDNGPSEDDPEQPMGSQDPAWVDPEADQVADDDLPAEADTEEGPR